MTQDMNNCKNDFAYISFTTFIKNCFKQEFWTRKALTNDIIPLLRALISLKVEKLTEFLFSSLFNMFHDNRPWLQLILAILFFQVLDAGTVSSLDTYSRPCDPKILVFDLSTDHLVRTIVFPTEVQRPASVFTNLVLDETIQGKCDSTFVYISDSVAPGQ